MADLSHVCGSDLAAGPTGDLAVASGDAETQQRIIRRLSSNAGDYLWHLLYGAGLPAQVGATINQAAITNIVRSQIFAEKSVAQVPAPVISVTAQANGATLNIQYTSAETGIPQTLNFTVPNGS